MNKTAREGLFRIHRLMKARTNRLLIVRALFFELRCIRASDEMVALFGSHRLSIGGRHAIASANQLSQHSALGSC